MPSRSDHEQLAHTAILPATSENTLYAQPMYLTLREHHSFDNSLRESTHHRHFEDGNRESFEDADFLKAWLPKDHLITTHDVRPILLLKLFRSHADDPVITIYRIACNCITQSQTG